MIHREMEKIQGGENALGIEDTERRVLREERFALSTLAQDGFREHGRGAILLGRSRSVEEIREGEDTSAYLVDYLSLMDLDNPQCTCLEEARPSAVEKVIGLMQIYEPAQEFIAVFFGGNGFENVYRVSNVAEGAS